MEFHNLTQGSPEWHAHRLTHFNASDAPAMMGCSSYKTRSQLLHEMHTGMAPEVDAATQRRFDDGHRFEALARPLAEAIIDDDLYPVVGSLQEKSASYDGLTMDRKVCFEHKSLNAELRECMEGEDEANRLPLQYRVQMEQQLLVADAEKCLFMASKWNGDELVEERHCWYYPDHQLRQKIIDGWIQFEADLAAYTPIETVAAPVGRTPEALPALHIEVTGMVTASNLAEYKARALAVFAGINRELVTDAHFADAEKTVKWCGDIETRLAAAKQHALSQTASIDQLFKTIDDISAEARATRLELDKLVKNRKDSIRSEIVADGRTAMIDHIAALNKRIGSALMPAIAYDFANAIKNKRTLESMRDAVSTELARAKSEATAIATKIAQNVKVIEDAGHVFLFSDRNTLVLKDPEFVSMTVKTRVDKHQADEAARLAAETARIAEQERVKAEAAAQSRADAEIAEATAKARAEARAQAAADADAEAKRASDEAIAKAAQTEKAYTLATAPPCHQTVVPVLIEKAIADNNAAAFIDKIEAKQPPSLRLGQICTRLGFQVTADFLKSLGFEPAGRERAAVLYHDSDLIKICRALVKHINQVCEMETI